MTKFKVLGEYIANNYSGKVVEVGVGSYYEVAEYLKRRGFKVITVDISPKREETVKDDVLNPRIKIYEGASLIYSIRPPYEIQESIIKLAEKIGCDAIIVPLKSEIIEGGKLTTYRGVSFYVFRR